MNRPLTMSLRTWADLVALSLIWGLSFLAMRIAVDEIGPLTIALHRVFWAALALLVFLHLRGKTMPRAPRAWAGFAVMGLLNNVIPFSLIAWGQQSIETGLASILNASTAIWGVALAALLIPDERLTGRRALGAGLGFAGILVAIGLDVARDLDLRSLGTLAVVTASLSYALAGVWARKQLSGHAPEVSATGMLIGSSLWLLPLASLVEGPPRLTLSLGTWAAILYVSLIATGLAYILYYRLIRAAGTGNTMLVTLLLVPVAIVAGAAVRGEALDANAFAGFAIVALGLLILDGRLRLPKNLWQRRRGKVS